VRVENYGCVDREAVGLCFEGDDADTLIVGTTPVPGLVALLDSRSVGHDLGGTWMNADDCLDLARLLEKVGRCMKAGATAEDAIRGLAGEGE